MIIAIYVYRQQQTKAQMFVHSTILVACQHTLASTINDGFSTTKAVEYS
jgi:hypothetical protein